MHEETAYTFVSPFGRQHTVQRGIEIKRSRTLREALTTDSSEYDLNPESCKGLKLRLLHDAT